jgi:isohexenylglutaconyl-CoA hydratase
MALPQTQNLLLEQDDGWLTVWLNRPEARNALSNEMAEELLQVAKVLARDNSIRGITIRGKGGTFCAGGDLKGFRTITQGDQSHADVAAFSRRAGELFHTINALPQVTVMLVEGAAMAGGLGLVCAGDVVVVTADTKFALTETMLGIPPAQIAPLIVQRIGLAKARRIMLTAARFEGREAGRLGIADEVVENANAFAAVEAALRKNVQLCAPGANAATKELVMAAPQLSRDEMLDRAADAFASCLLGEEGREGVASFIEKRKPRWAH